MDAFARADGEMMVALGADFQIFVQFLVENHRLARRAFRPKPLGNVAFFGFAAAELGFFGEGRLRVSAGGGVNAGSTESLPSDFFVNEVVSIDWMILLKSARNCPDANIARARRPQRLRAGARGRAGRKNVVHQNHAFAVQADAVANRKRAAHVRRALLAGQPRLGRRGQDAPEQFLFTGICGGAQMTGQPFRPG
jgi:hypothetical protein